jgi:hypothetical protein
MEMRHHARKIPIVGLLDYLAKAVTGTARPRSYFRLPPHRDISSYQGGDYVFKRSHSAGFEHVRIPERDGGGSVEKDNNGVVDEGFDFEDEMRWFIQDHVPLLKGFECRVGVCLQRPEKKVIFRKWTSRNVSATPNGGMYWDCDDVGDLVDISTLQ